MSDPMEVLSDTLAERIAADILTGSRLGVLRSPHDYIDVASETVRVVLREVSALRSPEERTREGNPNA